MTALFLLNRDRLLFLAIAIASLSGHVGAADYFLTIGGGYEPSGNQISLEKNVQYFQRTLHRLGHDPANHWILFADGRAPDRDLQYTDLNVFNSPAETWMNRILGDESEATMRYRDHQVSPVFGASRTAWVDAAMDAITAKLIDGDRLIIYVTAHGSPAASDDEYDYSSYSTSASTSDDSSNPRNTSIALWSDESITAEQWTEYLDRIPANVEVVMMMVQCYSGGFAQTIFNDADYEQGISPRVRCGFFSQVYDRQSAGCTPDVNEAEYQEYSSFFWAALSGVNRLGDVIDSQCDYNGDRVVGFNEAHAYAVIQSDNIDIPIQTSSELLRRISKLGKISADETASEPDKEESPVFSGIFNMFSGKKIEPLEPQVATLLTPAMTIDEVRELASPDQQAIIDALAVKLKVKTARSVASVAKLCRKLETDIESQTGKYTVVATKLSDAQNDLSTALQRTWPEVPRYGYSPMVTQLTTSRGDEFVATVESWPQAEAYVTMSEKTTKAAERLYQVETREAITRRLLRTLQDVLLEANLPLAATSQEIQRFEQLRTLEASGLAVK